MRLEYSLEAEKEYGYSIAELANGKKIEFTNRVPDESDTADIESKYQWKDKKIAYQGKDSDIVSFDYSNKKRTNLNGNAIELEEFNLSLQNHTPIVGSILNIRETALKSSKELPNKKPLK